MVAPPPDRIIRHIRLAHCKRGPERCETCREMDQGRWCLLDIEPPDAGLVQRRVIEVELDGETQWREFDVERVFSDEAEAQAYAAEHGLPDPRQEFRTPGAGSSRSPVS